MPAATALVALAGLSVATAVAAAADLPAATVRIPAGSYAPQFTTDSEQVAVSAFELDVYPVTNADFLRFVQRYPQWQKSHVPALFADEAYLDHWEADTAPGERAPDRAPVTNVSWFAAKAYCEAQGKRLPTQDEWELAASADADAPQPADIKAYNRMILDWYAKPTRLPLPAVGEGFRNFWGVWDLHGLVWEWVADFNSQLSMGVARMDAGGLDRQLFCAAGSVGSADPGNYAAFMRYAMRGSTAARYAVQNMGFRCARDAPEPVDPHAAHREVEVAAVAAPAGMSLHQLESRWTNQHGTELSLADFAGDTVVIAMVYTHCDYACPRIIGEMRRIRDQVNPDAGKLQLILASIDPERDSVEHLAAFGADTGLTAQGWQLLRAPDATVRELAAVLGVQYRRVSDTDFAHANVITVLGPNGDIRYRHQGLGGSLADVLSAIHQSP